jgi:hypothetical protein
MRSPSVAARRHHFLHRAVADGLRIALALHHQPHPVPLRVVLPDEDDAAPTDGIAYERFCATLLERAGWDARTSS